MLLPAAVLLVLGAAAVYAYSVLGLGGSGGSSATGIKEKAKAAIGANGGVKTGEFMFHWGYTLRIRD